MIAVTATLLAGCESDSVVAAPPARSPDRFANAEITAAANQLLRTELTPVNGVLSWRLPMCEPGTSAARAARCRTSSTS